MWRIRKAFRYIRWLFTGRKMIWYPGFMCGCCGAWRDIPFVIPEWDSNGEWWDTVGLCPDWATRHGG